MTDRDSRTKRQNELWAAYVSNLASQNELDRVKDAVDQLRVLRAVHSDKMASSDHVGALSTINRGRIVLSILNAELGEWLVELPGDGRSMNDPSAWIGLEREALLGQIALAESTLPPLHRDGVDPSTLLLPRWLFLQLSDSLAALNDGEVRPLVQPAATGRHDDPWSWDRMRLRAIQHVAFLNGQGIPITLSRQRVGASMKVSPETLRKWEVDFNASPEQRRIEHAKAAGGLKTIFEDDPRYAEADGNSVDAHAMRCLEDLRREPLSMFAEFYRLEFGRRHNQ